MRESHITAASAGRVLIDWRGSFERLSKHPARALPDEPSLYVGSYFSSFAISKLRLVPISETGKGVVEPQPDSPED